MKTKKLPQSIINMITTDYIKGLTSKQSANRINKTTTARKLDIQLSTRQVAAHQAWITMRS